MCHVTGFPRAVITWVKAFNNLEQSRAVVEDGQLSIISTQKKDSGLYKCTASNQLGHDSAITQLNVVELPNFAARPPSQLEVGDGGPTTTNHLGERKRGATCWEIGSWRGWNTKNVES